MTLVSLRLCLALLLASQALGQTSQPTPQPTPVKNRGNPGPNADPTDTNNPRLNGKRFPFDNIPEKADTSTSIRGTQTGINRCNATTEGPTSMCQTAVLNSLDDFCIFAPPDPNSSIGGTEEKEVAWCTKPGHGTRIIPQGALTGVQFIKAPSYLEVTGHIKQTMINIKNGDGGGELDSGGQDLRGNPIGGLMYSNNLPSAPGQYTQVITWHMFLGGGIFCFKACDPKAPNAAAICEHRFDTLGCNTNIPAAYVDGVFLSCEGEDQGPVTPGVTAIPISSSCQTLQSTSLYAASVPTTASASVPVPSNTSGAPAGAGTTPGTASIPNGSAPPASNPTTTPASQSAAATRSRGGIIGVAVVGALVGAALLL